MFVGVGVGVWNVFFGCGWVFIFVCCLLLLEVVFVEKQLDVVDFKDVKRQCVRNIAELVGGTFLIVRVGRVNSSVGFVTVELSDGVVRDFKVRGRVLLKQLSMISEYTAKGYKVRVTLVKKQNRNGREYYVFV